MADIKVCINYTKNAAALEGVDVSSFTSQAVANKFADMVCTMGRANAVRLLQRSVGSPETGALDPATITGVNCSNSIEYRLVNLSIAYCRSKGLPIDRALLDGNGRKVVTGAS
jgi:hypothetical protein